MARSRKSHQKEDKYYFRVIFYKVSHFSIQLVVACATNRINRNEIRDIGLFCLSCQTMLIQ